MKKLFLFILLASGLGFSQVTVAPFVSPAVQLFDNSGLPLNGGKVCTFAAGTSTPLATYSDNGVTLNANPVVLDSAGRGVIYLQNASYKIVIAASTANSSCVPAIKTQDNVSWANLASTVNSLISNGTLQVIPSTAATGGANQTGPNTQFCGNYWTGAASAADCWTLADILGTGSNPTSTLTLTHSGSSGASTFSVPGAVTVGGTLGVTGATTLNGGGTLAGNFDSGPTQTISTITASGLTATVTTVGICTVTAGDAIGITGSSVASYNTLATNSLGGVNPPMWIAQTSCSGGSTFTYQVTISGLGASAGGTLKRSPRFISNITNTSGHTNNQNSTIAGGDFTNHNTFNYSSVSVGGSLPGGQFDFNTAITRSQGSNPMVIAHAVGMEYPSSGTNFYGAAVGSFINCGAGVACAGTYTQAICLATNCKVWGDNPQVQDVVDANTGKSLNGMESDVVPNNASTAYTAVTGMFAVLGGGSHAGTYGDGAVVQSNNVATLWGNGYRCAHGGTVNCIYVGKAAASGVTASQTVSFLSNNGGADLTGTIKTDAAGNFFVAPTSGSSIFLRGTVVNDLADLSLNAPAYVQTQKPFKFQENAAPSGVAGQGVVWADSSDHMMKYNPNNGGEQHVPQIYRLTAQYTNSTTNFTTVGTPNIAFPVNASQNYVAECHLYYQAAGTGGLNIEFTGPSAPTAVTYGLNLPVSATANAGNGVATSFGSSLGAVVTTATTNFDAIVSFSLINGANAGTVTLLAKSSAAAQLQIQIGSYCQVQ